MFSPSSNINPCHSSFFDRDYLRSDMGIISGSGSFAVLGSFADPYRTVIVLICYNCEAFSKLSSLVVETSPVSWA